jgi:hypothetical protein
MKFRKEGKGKGRRYDSLIQTKNWSIFRQRTGRFLTPPLYIILIVYSTFTTSKTSSESVGAPSTG